MKMVIVTVAVVYGIIKWPEPKDDTLISSLFRRSTKNSYVNIDASDVKILTAEIAKSVNRNFRGRGGLVSVDEVAKQTDDEIAKSSLVNGKVTRQTGTQPRYAITVHNGSIPPVVFRGKRLSRRDFYKPEPKGIRYAENVLPVEVYAENPNYNLFHLADMAEYCSSLSIEKHCMRMRAKEKKFGVLVNPVYSTYAQFLSFNKR